MFAANEGAVAAPTAGLHFTSALEQAHVNLVPGSADGTGASARFNIPFGIAVDAAGTLYVADTGNNRVLEYDSPASTGA